MKKIFLTQGKVALVDDADFDWLNQWKWSLGSKSSGGYARRKEAGKHILMHRLIMGFPVGLQVDHINRNPHDNQRKNLRIVTRSQNCWNRKANGERRFKGVFVRWQAIIMAGGKRFHLGSFSSEGAAARAYDRAAKRLHGDFAQLNFPARARG